MKKIFIVTIILLLFSPIAYAEVVTLFNGKVVVGDIVERDNEGIFVFSGYGAPEKYTLNEIEKIELEDSGEDSFLRNIRESYGIKFDVSSLPKNYSLTNLIILLPEITDSFGLPIDGVKVLRQDVANDFARLAVTADIGRRSKAAEDRKNILIISYNLAYDVERILTVLNNGPLTEKETLYRRVEKARQDSVESFFSGGEIKDSEKHNFSAKIAGGSARMIKGLRKTMNDMRTKKSLRVYDYYLSFGDLFNDHSEIERDYFDDGNVSSERSYTNGRLNGWSREYFEDGTIRNEVFFKDGVRSGLYKEYFESGILKYIEPYEDGMVHGEVKEYYFDGNIAQESSFEEGILNGISREYYENGKVKSEQSYIDNVKNGPSFIYYENGNPYLVVGYKNDIKHGEVKQFFADGKVQLEMMFDEGVLVGSYKEYFENGNLDKYYQYWEGNLNGVSKEYYEEGNIKNEVTFINNKRNGPTVEYFKNGVVSLKVNYLNDVEDKEYIEFYENGTVKQKVFFDHGERINTFEMFSKDGTLSYIESYKNGLVDGSAKEFYPDGSVHIESIYSDGNLIKQVVYDEKGNKI